MNSTGLSKLFWKGGTKTPCYVRADQLLELGLGASTKARIRARANCWARNSVGPYYIS